jgi:hypothetical protein
MFVCLGRSSLRQLLEVERSWRDMKQVIDLRPIYHRREDRIRAHVILCWLALLLARISENATGRTWPDLDTRRRTSRRRVSARQPPNSWPSALHQLRNPGSRPHQKPAP